MIRLAIRKSDGSLILQDGISTLSLFRVTNPNFENGLKKILGLKNLKIESEVMEALRLILIKFI